MLSKTHQETLRQTIFARILEPSSKRCLSDISEKKIDKAIPLDRIYRMMDKLMAVSTDVENKVFTATEIRFIRILLIDLSVK